MKSSNRRWKSVCVGLVALALAFLVPEMVSAEERMVGTEELKNLDTSKNSNLWRRDAGVGIGRPFGPVFRFLMSVSGVSERVFLYPGALRALSQTRRFIL